MWLRKIAKLAFLALFTLGAFSLRALSANDPALPAFAMADKVVVLKGERKLLLMKSDEVLKHTPSRLEEIQSAAKSGKATAKRLKATMCSIGIMRIASITSPFTSLIQMRKM
jgi:hypothetical protein